MSFAEDPAKFIGSDATVADKIRALDAAGYPRAEIARMLGKRYQHVRNVLEGDKLKAQAPKGAQRSSWSSNVESLPDGSLRVGNLFRLSIGPGGTVRLPKEVMAFGYREGGVLLAELEGERFVIISPKESYRRVREQIPPLKPGEPLMSEELIAERRRENARDEEETAARVRDSNG